MEFIQSTLFSNVVAFLALGLSAYSIFILVLKISSVLLLAILISTMKIIL
ncbi:hypothetical protein U142_01911 [Staphylococcus aureus F41902]|nr:hypothetical protein U142_01911 [Staphylococcus aureus F41902]